MGLRSSWTPFFSEHFGVLILFPGKEVFDPEVCSGSWLIVEVVWCGVVMALGLVGTNVMKRGGRYPREAPLLWNDNHVCVMKVVAKA